MELSDESSSRMLVEVQLLGQISNGRFVRGVDRYPDVSNPVEQISDCDLDVIFGKDVTQDQLGHFVLGKYAVNDRYTVHLTGKHFFSIDITHYCDDRVVGDITLFVVIKDFLTRKLLNNCLMPNDRVTRRVHFVTNLI